MIRRYLAALTPDARTQAVVAMRPRTSGDVVWWEGRYWCKRHNVALGGPGEQRPCPMCADERGAA